MVRRSYGHEGKLPLGLIRQAGEGAAPEEPKPFPLVPEQDVPAGVDESLTEADFIVDTIDFDPSTALVGDLDTFAETFKVADYPLTANRSEKRAFLTEWLEKNEEDEDS